LTEGKPTQEKMHDAEGQMRRIAVGMGKIKHKIVVLSGKGGVGKSTVTANLAISLAKRGNNKVGILDADITGPSIPKILGVRSEQMNSGPTGIFPAVGPAGVKLVSMDFMLPSDETPVIWRGPLKSMAIRQFLADVTWGDLDYLIIDLPPGTGDEALSVMQLIPKIDGVVIVTIPSDLSQIVVKKAVTFTQKMEAPVIGVVENMSGFICPKCGAVTEIFNVGGGQKISDDLNIPFLGKIPLDAKISEGSDLGLPFTVKNQDAPAAKAFMEIVEKIESFVKKGKTEKTES